MDRDLKLFRDLMLTLWDHHEKPWEYSHKEAQKIYAEIGGHFLTLSDTSELQALLSSEESVMGGEFKSRYVYLNPVTHGTIMVPVLTLKSDFGRSIPEVRFQLGLFLLHEEKIRWLGFRFEAPEGRDVHGAGRHHYYHIQMIRGLHTAIPFPSNKHLEWIPDAEPTFPLDVSDPVKLLLSLLVSLYGVEEVLTLIRYSSSHAQLRQCFGEMNCYQFDPIERYWKVTKKVTTGKKPQVEYWKSLKEPSEFHKYFTAKYAGCKIDGVTKGAFDSARKSKSF